jgi:hypothetical protein
MKNRAALALLTLVSALGAAEVVLGKELLMEPTGFSFWRPESMADACKVEKIEAGYQGKLVHRVTKARKGGFVLKHDGLQVEQGKTYTFSFAAKTDAPARRFGILFGLPENPYSMLSTKKEMVDLTNTWRSYTIDLTVAKKPASPAALVFSLYVSGTFEFADMSLKEDLSPVGPKHLFILSGQSNMQGHRPAEAFTPTVATAFGRKNAIVVQDALGGQPMQRWYKKWVSPAGEKPTTTGDLYDRLMAKVNAETKGKEIASVTFIWMQGERDAKMKWGEVYEASLLGLIQQLGDDLGRRDLNVVVGRLSDFDLRGERYPHWTMVREAQVKVAKEIPYGAWIDTDDLNDGVNRRGKRIANDLHYSAEGYKVLGTRFAEAAISLIRKRAEAAGK